MNRLVIGILAHVDAGKTTLSEAMLYLCGSIRRLGRVDHQNAFLDNFALERERGITIFSKQARMTVQDMELQLLDTPGHVDFSAETERTLQVLDAAVLVISGTDGVQGHTRTLWQLLERYHVPTFLFVNKMDLPGTDRAALLSDVQRQLDSGCVDFSAEESVWLEEAASRDEDAIAEYLETETLSRNMIVRLVRSRTLFPVWFGSALKLQGVDALLNGLSQYTPAPLYPSAFGARVYKISRDAQGARLTWLKVTGGTLKVKMPLSNGRSENQAAWEEKPDQIRLYSGAKFQTADSVEAGTVCAVTGLTHTVSGMGLGIEPDGETPVLEPVLTYQVELPEGTEPHTALEQLRMLEEEDPLLRVVWNEALHEIHIQLMGEIQMEILQRLIAERFGLTVRFGQGSIVYRETIANTVEGIGHFEPLRHYAEVHLLLEPGESGSGIQIATVCPEDQLDRNWQRLILSHILERGHPGVLTGSMLTDVRITLTAGRAHVKHTEGGDFRQATYRAIRQGLMQAENVLLEPWYEFRLELPTMQAGRAMADIQRMGGQCATPETKGNETILTGSAPLSELQNYGSNVAAYTKGQGHLQCTLKGYAPCHNAAAVIAAIGYQPERDLENPPDSVFCSHGSGYIVKWNQVPSMAHVDSGLHLSHSPPPEPARTVPQMSGYGGTSEEDAALQAIFERTYGKTKDRAFLAREQRRALDEAASKRLQVPSKYTGPEYLLVDGYNIIFAWDELKAVARESLDAARKNLMDILSNFQGFRKCVLILVFDAYKVPHNTGDVTKYHNIYVVYTKEAETADAYIERATYRIGSGHRVRVATSDNAEQLIILGHGALRVSASAFHEEVETAEGQIAAILAKNNRREKSRSVRHALERAKEKKN